MGKIGNTGQSCQRCYWSFTFNNYDEKNIETILQYFKLNCKEYYFQEEVGESGTPHLQGSIELKTRKRLTELKKLNEKIHWEATRNIDASNKYCQKPSFEGARRWTKEDNFVPIKLILS